jgi:asparagine synthase (glutamine-hydrolysing)
MGFSVPIGDWLRGRLRGWAEELLFTRTGSDGFLRLEQTRPGWERLQGGDDEAALGFWALLMFESWRRHWLH